MMFYKMNKDLIRSIYEFSKEKEIRSFHSVAYSISPTKTLTQILNRGDVQPEHFIIVNSLIPSYKKDKKILENTFGIRVVIEFHDPKLFIEL